MPHLNNSEKGNRDRNGRFPELFKTLDFKQSRKGFFWTSIAVHGALLSVLLLVPLIYTDTIKAKFDFVLTVPPLPEKQISDTVPIQPRPLEQPPIEQKRLPAPPVAPKPVLIEPPEMRPAEIPQIARLKEPDIAEPDKPALNVPEAPAPVPRMPEVRTGTFLAPSLPVQAIDKPAQQVQMGGFGEQVAGKVSGRPARVVNVASLDLVDAVQRGGRKENRPDRGVHQGGFDEMSDRAKSEPLKKQMRPEAAEIPVEILSKPRPDYTDKARTARIEGDVLLRVLFSASGEVRVLDVIRSLGYGLDENAALAARQIRFRPAQRDGQPVDSTATVHIVFQLAY
jgi:TonB family protein